MFLKYDPLQQKYKSITGAVPISLPFVVSVHSDAAAVELMLKKEGEGEAGYLSAGAARFAGNRC